jgi:hypothetical protein
LALLITHYSLLIGVNITLQYGPSHWINYILSKLLLLLFGLPALVPRRMLLYLNVLLNP